MNKMTNKQKATLYTAVVFIAIIIFLLAVFCPEWIINLLLIGFIFGIVILGMSLSIYDFFIQYFNDKETKTEK